jgi:tetratricopeptide (TPR) repeat protein
MDKILITQEIITELKLKIKEQHKDTYKYANQIYNTYDKFGDFSLITQFTILYSRVLGIYKSNYEKSIDVLNKIKRNERLTECPLVLIAEVDFYLGYSHQYLGNFIDSFICYNNAIQNFEKIDFIKPNEELNIANALINIVALHKLNDYEEYDKKDVSKALSIYKKHKAKFGIPGCYNLYAAFSLHNKNYKDAMMYAKRSLSLCIELNNEIYTSVCFSNIANIHALTGEFDKAFLYMKKCQNIIEKYNNEFHNALFDKNLADIYSLKNDLKKTITHYRKALDFFEAKGNKDILLEIYKGLTEIYVKTNHYKKAFMFQQKYLDIKQSIFKFDKLSALYKNNSKILENL